MNKSSTVETLVKVIMTDSFEYLNLPCINDYFGMHNYDNDDRDEIIEILLGLYQGMYKFRNITKNQLHEACINNKIDKLIDDTYKNSETGYYEKYKEKKIKVNIF